MFEWRWVSALEPELAEGCAPLDQINWRARDRCVVLWLQLPVQHDHAAELALRVTQEVTRWSLAARLVLFVINHIINGIHL